MNLNRIVLGLFTCSSLILPSYPRIPGVSFQVEVEGVTYADTIPKPEAIIGHQIGSAHTRPEQVVRYFEAVAALSDRVKVESHGSTYEGRPLIHAFVSSPSNLQRLEEIRRQNLQLSDHPDQVSDRDLEKMPAIVTMGYSVHGNEASGTEAALLLLYHLAAGNGEPVDRVLKDCVVLIDPMLNPDGRARFVNWVNANRGRVANSDPQDREHVEPWPGGRTNHYWFDLNRDWLPAQLAESRGRLQLFHEWRPQMVTDYHEMGSNSTFFFQPGVPTRNNPNTPQRNFELTKRIGAFHARYLDQIGSLYYSEENYDDFYFGKGSTYPDINGSVGILFEQASSRGLSREAASGTIDYGFTIRNQFTASISSLDAAVSMRIDLLANQRDFYREAAEAARKKTVRGWVFSADHPGGRAEPMIEVLLRHDIEVYELSKDLTIDGRTFAVGQSWLLPEVQRQTRLLDVLMERVTDFSDSIFYDVSTWTLPLAFGINASPVAERLDNYLGSRVNAPLESPGLVTGMDDPYAYLMDWSHHRAPEALYMIQAAGLVARSLTEGVTVNSAGKPWKVGPATIVIPGTQVKASRAEVRRIIQEAARRTGVSFVGADSGLTAEGPDLGGPSSVLLKTPAVGLLCGPGTSSSQAGEAWFVLNERAGIPVSLLETDRFDQTDLSRYNTIIMPGGSYGSISEQHAETIKQWVRRGGLLIAFQGAIRTLIGKQVIDEQLREWTTSAGQVPYSQVEASRRAQDMPGSIFEVQLDATHPLASGLPAKLPVFRDSTLLLEPSKIPGSNVAVYTPDPLLSGYVASEKLPQLAGSSAVLARRIGDGHIVLFADDPNFRAFWYGTTQLFFNALFLGQAF
jgi:hypothetical protein